MAHRGPASLAYADQLHRWLKPGGRLAALVMQCRRDGAADGLVEGPPCHLDINAVRALFPAALWSWPAPPTPAWPTPLHSAKNSPSSSSGGEPRPAFRQSLVTRC